jgi:hypothetical protein
VEWIATQLRSIDDSDSSKWSSIDELLLGAQQQGARSWDYPKDHYLRYKTSVEVGPRLKQEGWGYAGEFDEENVTAEHVVSKTVSLQVRRG